MKKIYLAGPEVFLPNATSVLNSMKQRCTEFGFIGLSPFDSVLKSTNVHGMNLAHEIFKGNVSLIKECDIILANCNAFRGALVDDGTSFEIGYALSLHKTIYGYINKIQTLPEIVKAKVTTKMHESGFPIDEEGYLVNEDFGNSINLMLEFAIRESNGQLVEGDFEKALRIISDKSR